MKKLIRVLPLLILTLVLTLTACAEKITAIQLKTENDVTELTAGSSVQLLVSANIEIDFVVEYVITSNSDKATVNQTGKLTIKEDTASNTIIKVVAKFQEITSNEIEIKVIDVALTALSISSASQEVIQGNSLTLNVLYTPANATHKNVTWEVVGSYPGVSFTGNILNVSLDAAVGNFKVVAKNGNIVSNELTITVLEKVILTITSNKTTAKPGETVEFNVNVIKAAYSIKEGADKAEITAAGILTIKENAIPGSTIIVIATLNSEVSNEIAITIEHIELTSIAVNLSTVEIFQGGQITLQANLTPNNTTQKDITWEITNSYEDARIEGNKLIVNANASLDDIVIVAKRGNIVSASYTLTVITTSELEIFSDVSTAKPNDTIQITVELGDMDLNIEEVTLIAKKGAANVTISANGIVTIKSDASGGEVIIVAEYKGITSADLVINIYVPLVSLEVTATKYTVYPGQSITLGANLTPINTTDVEINWKLTNDYLGVRISGIHLYIDGTAIVGSFQVIAYFDDIESTPITITILPLPDVLLETAESVTELKPGDKIELIASYIDGVDIELIIETGASYASINANGELVINVNAIPGNTVVVYAKAGGYQSASLTFTIVHIEVTSIVAEAEGSTDVFQGSNVTINVKYTPANTTQKGVIYTLKENYADVSIEGNVLVIGKNVSYGISITVCIESTFNSAVKTEITINIKEPSSDEALYVDFIDNFEIIKDEKVIIFENRSTNPEKVLNVSVTDSEGRIFANATVVFTIKTGSGVVSFEHKAGDYHIALKLLAHGEAIITAQVSDKTAIAEIKVKTIKTPDEILLPDYLNTKSYIDYKVGVEQEFSFEGTIEDQTACQEVKYVFEQEGSAFTSDELGSYNAETKKIIFFKQGIIKVKIVSDSGRLNASEEIDTEYMFYVNNGINVSTWEELKEACEEDTGEVSKNINIVVTKKLADGTYDIIPLGIINGDVTLSEAFNDNKISIAITSGITLNGNNYVINFQKLKKFDLGGDNRLMFKPLIDVNILDNKTYDVNFNDMIIEGNVNLNGSVRSNSEESHNVRPVEIDGSSTGKLLGVHEQAIRIGLNDGNNTTARYKLNMKNVTVRYFTNGMRINRAVDSKMSNITIDQCYIAGIDIAGSIIEIHNVTAGKFGLTAFDLTQSNYLAGENNDQNGQVTFTGDFNVSNYNNTATEYLKRYTFNNATVGMALGDYRAAIYKEIDPIAVALGKPVEELRELIVGNIFDFDTETFNFSSFNMDTVSGVTLIENLTEVKYLDANNNSNVASFEAHLTYLKGLLAINNVNGFLTNAKVTNVQFMSFEIPIKLTAQATLYLRMTVENPHYIGK